MNDPNCPGSCRFPCARRLTMRLLRLLGALGLAGSVAAQTVSVGPGAGCDFPTLQDAVDSIDRGEAISLRLVNGSNGFAAEPVLIVDRSVAIFGGYDDCSDTTADPEQRSVIRGAGAMSVLHVSGFAHASASQVTLENVRIEGGYAPNGGGMRISGDNRVRLSNVIITGNSAERHGGGIYIDGSRGAQLVLEHGTRVEGNEADRRGGGIACVAGTIDFRDGAVSGNRAQWHGGGIHLDDCALRGNAPGRREIVGNRLRLREWILGEPGNQYFVGGGGVFARGASTIALGSAASVTLIADNDVHVRDEGDGTVSRGEGGGLMLTGTSVAELTNAHIVGNRANEGAGVLATNTAMLRLSRHADGCPAASGYAGCASIADNLAEGYQYGFTGCFLTGSIFAGRGGAIALRRGAHATLDGVRIRGNRLTEPGGCILDNDHPQYPHGAAFDIRGGFAPSLVLINSVVHGNASMDEHDVVHVRGAGASFVAAHSTLAANAAAYEALIRTAGANPRVALYSSIVHDPGERLFANDGADAPSLRADCVLASTLAHFDDIADHEITRSVGSNSPGFVDVDGGDFRLAPGAAAADRCDLAVLRLEGLSDAAVRDIDRVRRPHAEAPSAVAWDLGAHERATGTAPPLSDFALRLTDGGFAVGPGASMGYLASVSNMGPAPADGAAFTLQLDPSLALPLAVVPFDARWTCLAQGSQVACRWPERLNVGAQTPQVAVQTSAPPQPTAVVSRGELLHDGSRVDPMAGNDAVEVTTSIGLAANVAAVIRRPVDGAAAGEVVRVRAALRNEGPDVAIGPKLSFHLPAEFGVPSIADSPGTAWRCVPPRVVADGRWMVGCAADAIGVGDHEFVLAAPMPVDAVGGQYYAVEAYATASSDGDADHDNRDVVELVAAPGRADLALAAVAPEVVHPQGPSLWIFDLVNHGPAGASAVRIDLMAEGGGVTQARAPSPWDCRVLQADPGQVRCTLHGGLVPDQTQRLSLTVDAASLRAPRFGFAALAAAEEPDPMPHDNAAQPSAPVDATVEVYRIFGDSFEIPPP